MDFNSIEAEQGLLGCLFLHNEKIFDIAGTVRPEDFAHLFHADVFAKSYELITAGKSFSPVALKPYFIGRTDADENYLIELAASAFGVINAESYAQTIRDMADKRRLQEIIRALQESMLSKSADEVRSEAMGLLEKTAGTSIFVKTKRQVAMEACEAVKLPPQCYTTGLQGLDNAMAGGLYAGFTYGLCGAAKRGKTTFAHTISENLNENGVPHAYIALEMGSQQIEQRNIARRIGVNSLAFMAKEKNPAILSRMAQEAVIGKDHTLYLDMPGCSFNQIKGEIARLVSKRQITGFILDYWQLVQGGEKHQSKADFLYDVAQWCANFSRRHKIWCVILSQLNREGQVFGSAGLEKACDQMFFIEKAETNCDVTELYLTMTHSRYTPMADVGTNERPAFYINQKHGPHIAEI